MTLTNQPPYLTYLRNAYKNTCEWSGRDVVWPSQAPTMIISTLKHIAEPVDTSTASPYDASCVRLCNWAYLSTSS